MEQNQLAKVADPILKEGAALVARAKALEISTKEHYDAGAEFLRDLATLKKRVGETVDPVVDAANKAHKAATGMRADMLKAPSEADEIVRRKMLTWKQGEDRRIAEEAAAEQKRRQKELDDAAQAQAEQLQAAGHEELAEMVMETAPVAGPPAPVKVAAQGVSTTKVWRFCLLPEAKSHQVDEEEAALMEQAAAALDSSAPINLPAIDLLTRNLRTRAKVIRARLKRCYMVADEKAIGQQVKALKSDAEKLCGGLQVYTEEQMAVRAR